MKTNSTIGELADALFDRWHERDARQHACVNAMAGIKDPAAYVQAMDALIEKTETALREAVADEMDEWFTDLKAALQSARAAKGDV